MMWLPSEMPAEANSSSRGVSVADGGDSAFSVHPVSAIRRSSEYKSMAMSTFRTHLLLPGDNSFGPRGNTSLVHLASD